MRAQMGCIFLSHSSAEKDYVDQVVGRLPSSHIFYDTKTIYPGEDNTEAIETAVTTTDVFVLFLSPETMKREYVRLETELVKAAKIRRDYLRVIIVPIKGATYQNAPKWMQGFNTTKPDYTVGDVARLIWNSYLEVLQKKGALPERPFIGRETLIRDISLEYRNRLRDTATIPNFIHLAGIEQMGRSSLARNLIQELFPTAYRFPVEFSLKASADSIDLYLALFEEIEGPQEPKTYKELIGEFAQLSGEIQAEKIFEKLRHYAIIGQAVLVKSAMGLRDKSRAPKDWVTSLLKRLQGDTEHKIFWVSERRLPAEMISDHPNLLEFEVPAITDGDIQYLLESLVVQETFLASDFKDLASCLNGHPGTAYFVSSLVNRGQRTPVALVDDKDLIKSHQDRFVSSTIGQYELDSLEAAILYWLTVLPFCDYNTLKKLAFSVKGTTDINSELSELVESCLVRLSTDSSYSLPKIVQSSVLHRMESHPPNLVAALGQILQDGIGDEKTKLANLDLLIHIYAFLGKDLPDELKDLVTPSELHEIVSQSYRNGLATQGAETVRFLENTSKYAGLAIGMRGSDDVREEILLFGAEAEVRLGRAPNKFTDEMARLGYQSVHLALGSHALYNSRDNQTAADELKKSFEAKVFRKRSARLLTRAYLLLRQPQDALEVLNRLGASIVDRDSGLLYSKIKALKSMGRHREIPQLKDKLTNLPDDFGNLELSIITDAIRRRDGLENALIACHRYRQKPKSNRLNAMFLEAIINIEMGNLENAAEAIHLAQSIGRNKDYHGLMARKLLKEGNPEEAYAHYSEISPPNLYDQILFLEICDTLISNNSEMLKSQNIQAKKASVLAKIRSVPDDVFH